MKLLESWVQLEQHAKRSEKQGHSVNVMACKMYIDTFGKYHIQCSIFDSFSSIKQALNSKDLLCDQASNILDKFKGFKL